MISIDRTALLAWMVTAFALYLKMSFNLAVQAISRVRHRAFVKPEDAAFFGGNATSRA